MGLVTRRALRFQFTHPVWGATGVSIIRCISLLFQFTHPVWGATRDDVILVEQVGVSIHAPRVGCDLGDPAHLGGAQSVSIHAPRVGCDIFAAAT